MSRCSYFSGCSDISNENTEQANREGGGFLPALAATGVVITALVLVSYIWLACLHRQHQRRNSRGLQNPSTEMSPGERMKVIMASLESRVYKKKSDGEKGTFEGNDSDKRQCAICLGDYIEGDEISSSSNKACNHISHQRCIVEWLLKKDDCPLCRQPFIPSLTNSEHKSGNVSAMEAGLSDGEQSVAMDSSPISMSASEPEVEP